MGKGMRRGLAAALALVALAGVAVPLFLPAVAAYACPACYGLAALRPGLYVEQSMAPAERAALLADAERAVARVDAFYGGATGMPPLLVCASQTCDRRLGGRGARARAYGAWFVAVSPAGRSETILAHEFSHIALHRRFGTMALLGGRLPAWLDEGLAVVVSQDPRYLAPGTTAAERCRAEPRRDIGLSMRDWGRAAGKTPGLYAEAACRVLRWMEANGGQEALLAAIDLTARGAREMP